MPFTIDEYNRRNMQAEAEFRRQQYEDAERYWRNQQFNRQVTQGIPHNTILTWQWARHRLPDNPGWVLIGEFIQAHGKVCNIKNAIYTPLDKSFRVVDDDALLEVNENGVIERITLVTKYPQEKIPNLVWAVP